VSHDSAANSRYKTILKFILKIRYQVKKIIGLQMHMDTYEYTAT